MIPILENKAQFEVYTTLSAEEFSDYFFRELKEDMDNAWMKERWFHNKKYTYKGEFFRFAFCGFNRFNGVSSGRIQVDKNLGLITIKSIINFKEVLIYCLLFSLIPIMDYANQMSYRIILFCLIWAVYFGNYIISMVRVNEFFRKKMVYVYHTFDKNYKKKLLK